MSYLQKKKIRGHRPKLPAYLFKAQESGANLKVGLDSKAVTTCKKRFGKSLVFTDRTDLSALQVV